MELEYENYDNLDECEMVQYVKCCYNNLELCIICHLDELENNKEPWTKYNFKCNHKMHARCARKWFSTKNSLNCPYCGDIKLIKENMYCSECKIFGHSIYSSCPKYNNFINEHTIQNYQTGINTFDIPKYIFKQVITK